jgi:hypothetical protein
LVSIGPVKVEAMFEGDCGCFCSEKAVGIAPVEIGLRTDSKAEREREVRRNM